MFHEFNFDKSFAVTLAMAVIVGVASRQIPVVGKGVYREGHELNKQRGIGQQAQGWSI